MHLNDIVITESIVGTPKFCGGIANQNGTYCSPTSYSSIPENDAEQLSELTITPLTDVSNRPIGECDKIFDILISI